MYIILKVNSTRLWFGEKYYQNHEKKYYIQGNWYIIFNILTSAWMKFLIENIEQIQLSGIVISPKFQMIKARWNWIEFWSFDYMSPKARFIKIEFHRAFWEILE